MATANFSEDGMKETADLVFCLASLTAEIHGHLIFLSVLNIFLSITAFLGNVLILVGLHKESSLNPPSKLLLRSLAATDFCVGLISQPLFVFVLMSSLNERWDICFYTSVAGYAIGGILFEVSLLTMAAISVDRLLALLLGLSYRHVVTFKRSCVIVVTFWVVSAVFSAVSFWNSFITRWYVKIAASLCLITSILSYTKIFFTLRHHQTQVQNHVQQQGQTNPLNIARYRKAVSTALWLQLALVACYLPDIIVTAFVNTSELSSSVLLAYQYAITLTLFNSSLNPILYFWKMEEVKQAVKETIRQILCCL